MKYDEKTELGPKHSLETCEPIEKGVYVVSNKHSLYRLYSYWDGKEWKSVTGYVDYASGIDFRSGNIYDGMYTHFQGLA